MKIAPIRDSILFSFAQTTRDGFFRNETSWGFKIAGADFEASKCRWAVVEHVGPEVKKVNVGDYILIDALKWTTALEIDGKSLWRTAEPHVILTTDSKPKDII